mmetsp:Transcript_52060/g.97711  ORF Transcript_52060/g.97711 Transcript_52060/m.97711 type:complete len:654 (-) Transcript_52060:49-2010(-)
MLDKYRGNQRCSANICLDMGAVPKEDRSFVRAPCYLRFLVCFVFPLLYVAGFAAKYCNVGVNLAEQIWPSKNLTFIDDQGKGWSQVTDSYCEGDGYPYTANKIDEQFEFSLRECLSQCEGDTNCQFVTYGVWQKGVYAAFGGHFNQYRCQLYRECNVKRRNKMDIYVSGKGDAKPEQCLTVAAYNNGTFTNPCADKKKLLSLGLLLPVAINVAAIWGKQIVFLCAMILAAWTSYMGVADQNAYEPIELGLVLAQMVNTVVLLLMHCKLVVKLRDVQVGSHKCKKKYIPPVLAETGPVKPSSGSIQGGTHIIYDGVGEPVDVYINGRATAAVSGQFVVPAMLGTIDVETGFKKCDVKAVMADGTEYEYPEAFSYWEPGSISHIDPEKGPVTGNREVRIETSNLGAAISEVTLGGVDCDLSEEPSNTEAIIYLPETSAAGAVDLQVKSANGNSAASESCFQYYLPDCFGLVGDRIELSNEGRTARRAEGMNRGVCIGHFPVKLIKGKGYYFEVVVTDMVPSRNTIAIGFMAGKPSQEFVYKGKLSTRMTEASALKRTWLAGYDKAGAMFYSDGEQNKIPTSSWRPVRSLEVGSRIGALWTLSEAPNLVIYQDGEEKVSLKITGDLPSSSEELFFVVDVIGSVKSLALLEGAQPPV